MVLVNTDELLEKHLIGMYEQSLNDVKSASTQQEAEKRVAYAQGIDDVLKIVALHKEQSKEQILLSKGNETRHPDNTGPLKPHQMSAHEISISGLFNSKADALGHSSEKDLAEAAFKFENELIETLGDVNTIPFDSYTTLSKKELIRIIKKSVEDICRLKKEDTH